MLWLASLSDIKHWSMGLTLMYLTVLQRVVLQCGAVLHWFQVRVLPLSPPQRPPTRLLHCEPREV